MLMVVVWVLRLYALGATINVWGSSFLQGSILGRL